MHRYGKYKLVHSHPFNSRQEDWSPRLHISHITLIKKDFQNIYAQLLHLHNSILMNKCTYLFLLGMIKYILKVVSLKESNLPNIYIHVYVKAPITCTCVNRKPFSNVFF